ncbi:MAG: caspase family protein, partial [Desulfobacterales bacterium]|nr:caspase family protein [Desulfobacterales bacterium]
MNIDKISFGRVCILLLIIALCLAGCVPVDRASSRGSTELGGGSVGSAPVPDVREMRRRAVDREIGRWAVVVGISDYKYDNHRNPKGVPDLRFAHRDAKAFADFLLSPSGGAFAPDHVLLLTDGRATVKEVRKAIGGFLARSLERDLVIIYFSGHGAPDPNDP